MTFGWNRHVLGFADALFSFLFIEESFKKGINVSFVGLSEWFGELISVFFVVYAGIWSLMPSLFVSFRKPFTEKSPKTP